MMSLPAKKQGLLLSHSRKRWFRLNKKAKLREKVGIVDVKQSLNIAMLNVDGYSDSSFWNVEKILEEKTPDLCILLETKRRREDIEMDVGILGYTVIERRRSDSAGDKSGGGLLFYLRNDWSGFY